MRREFRLGACGGALLLLLIAAGLRAFQELSLPSRDGARFLPSLVENVEVVFDDFAIPRISARGRDDAFAALGYVTAKDRLFQMDLMRRRASGRLAEILGEALIDSDKEQRILGLEKVASEIVARLPPAQRSTLVAYASGVNRAMQDSLVWPLEFYLLWYRPEAWRPEDSLLALLGMEELISNTMYQERTASVMHRALDGEVFSFLTPDTDCFNETLVPSNPGRCESGVAPAKKLEPLFRDDKGGQSSGKLMAPAAAAGSNAWVVSGKKTRDGRAILANDMHLGLSVPNIWYRAELVYGSTHLAGLTLPGLPMILSGSNGRVAWGLTNSKADVVDLVALSEDPRAPQTYRVSDDDRSFGSRMEPIAVRGRGTTSFEVKETIWGPVSTQKLLGQEVAIHWTLLDPAASNLDILDMDGVGSVEEAVALFQHAGGPPLNVLLADEGGDIAWTITGRLPKRFGMSGLYSEDWSDGRRGWNGYLAPGELPIVLNPRSGLLVNTNNKMLGDDDFPIAIGHEYQGGVRAWRASMRLSGKKALSEADLAELQLDTAGDYYRYYRDLALKILAEDQDGDDAAIRRYIEAWDGRAELNSLGLPLIQEFIFALRESVLFPIAVRCRELDPEFQLNLTLLDDPVKRIIETNRVELLPDRGYADWTGFLRAVLKQTAHRLMASEG
ncbi:MAG TPA: penicillin acylase family protein, partial [Methylocystis sp.]|nr:penicillin acylase family protein [Methylocystis sp.]